MARPRYEDGEKSAYDRLVDGFWEMLACMPYGRMSVRELLRRTSLAKNTFYYHFDDMDDLARRAVATLTIPELPKLFISGAPATASNLGSMLLAPDNRLRLQRLSVLLSGNGSALQPLLTENVIEAWKEALGYHDEEVSEYIETLMAFAAGGLVSMLKDTPPDEYVVRFMKVSQHAAIRTCLAELWA